MVSLPAPPCTTVSPPWSATVVVPKSGPAWAVPLIVTWSAPAPSSRFTTSTLVFTACVVRVSPAMRNDPHVMPAGASDGVSLASSSVNVPPVVALSSKTLSTSICSDSGGTGVIARWLRLSSPGNSNAGSSERSAPLSPPSTVSEPSSAPTRCGRFGNVVVSPVARTRSAANTSPVTLTTSLPSPAITVTATRSRCREHVEGVVALEAVDVDELDAGEAGRAAGAVDLQAVDHEVVGQFGRDDCGEVGTCAAVDRDTRVGRVLREPADQRRP